MQTHLNGTMSERMDSLESVDGSGPTWMMLVYHLPFLLQVGLLHQKFQSKAFERHRDSFRLIRLGLIPINVLMGFEIMRKFCFYPLTRRGPLNLQFACWVAHLVMRSIEWGFVSTSPGDPTFQLHPDFRPHQPLQSNEKPPENPQADPGTDAENEESAHSYKDVLLWSINQLTSLRGINYIWGGGRRNQEKPTLLQTLRRFLICHICQVIGLVPLVMMRDHGSPTNALLALGIPNFFGLRIIAEGLGTLAWGLLCVYGMEFGFCLLVINAHLINLFSEYILELPSWFMQWWDLRLFVPLFRSPLTAKSLASLWASNWHQVYRRSFYFVGVVPATRLADRLGMGLKAQRLFGLLGAFIVSAIFHEVAISWVARPAHPSPYQFFNSFPGSLFYFLMQPVGILIEPYVIPLIPKWLGGGSLWVLVFTLITAQQFRNQYAFQNRVIDDTYPPFKDWPISGILWPSSIMQK
ncbi:hypothetical protein PTTG_07980 [Puccinia triticina 1-1 BBBD Race 1]|uniref:MBOAT_2 domain-containing protein n=1 Tax=Puccinia triticina (isolate 1-1 / race 1 (BBBD)) TaxID=630390 RepID=A0A180GIH6_PUCT1|nr:hypothetical protein PTTG_07980 [Puccinia triticina 1-1 BBBD Race 1]WAR57058.1 hypothetical protein PtB15_8B102 [Puccinia triticina]